MKSFTVPLVHGTIMTFFIGSGHLAVTKGKNPNVCTIVDGLHNNGGWEVALSADKVIALIKDAN